MCFIYKWRGWSAELAEMWDDKNLYQLTSPAEGKFSEEEYGDQIISSSKECGYQLHFQNRADFFFIISKFIPSELHINLILGYVYYQALLLFSKNTQSQFNYREEYYFKIIFYLSHFI